MLRSNRGSPLPCLETMEIFLYVFTALGRDHFHSLFSPNPLMSVLYYLLSLPGKPELLAWRIYLVNSPSPGKPSGPWKFSPLSWVIPSSQSLPWFRPLSFLTWMSGSPQSGPSPPHPSLIRPLPAAGLFLHAGPLLRLH